MSSITQINMNDIPSTVKLFTKGAKTKKIYLKGELRVAIEEFEKFITSFNLPFDEYITLAKSTSEELKILGSSGSKMKNVSIFIYKENNLIKEQSIGDRGALGIACYGSFLVEFDEPITIQSSRSSYIYYEEYNPIELKPMPKIDKLIDSSSFENVSTKLQEINNLLKVSSNNLKTIMDANNLMYEPTDNFSTLVQKLNSEPINFLLEGTKVRDILNKHLGATTYAGEVGSSYHYVCFTNIKRQSWTDLKEDLSLKKDGSISLYHELVDKSDRNYHNYYYIYSENKIYANKDSSYIFNTKKNGFKSIDFENIYFDYVENASYMFYNFGEGYGTGIFNINNLKLKNAKNINYIFNGSNIGNINFVVYDKMESYSNFSPKYSTITLDYVNDKSKKIAESIIASNNDLKLGTLVTQ